MAKKPETIFGEKFDKALKERFGDQCTNENIQQVGIIGTADRVICIRGKSVRVELKVEGGTVSPVQLIKLLEHKRAGGLSYVVYPYTMNDVINEMDVKTKGGTL